MSLGCAGGEQIFSCTSCFDIRYNVIMTPGKDGNAEAQAVLQWMEQAVGSRLLEYLVASTAEELPGLVAGDSTPSTEQVEVVVAFRQMQAAIPDELDNESAVNVVRSWLRQIGPDGRSVARSLHEHSIGDDGEESAPAAPDGIGAALVALALNAYPAFLLSPDPVMSGVMDELNISVTSGLFQDPQMTAFTESALTDQVLKDAFRHESEHVSRYAMVYRNTGSGSSVQLVMLPDLLLRSAWRHLSERASAYDLASQALIELQLVRDALAGIPRTVAAKLAFTGVPLPLGGELSVSNGIVRPVARTDRRVAPDSLSGQLTGTDSSGSSVVVNYDGDVILEYKYPYRVMTTLP